MDSVHLDIYDPKFLTEHFFTSQDAYYFFSVQNNDNELFEKYVGPAVFFALADEKLHIIKCNRRYMQEIGCNNVEEVYNYDPWTFFDADSKRDYLDTINKAINSKTEETCTNWRYVYRQSCGENMICLRSTIRLIASKGTEYLFYSFVSDVTAEKREYQAVYESEQKFSNAAEQANVYAWEYDIKTKEMRPCYRCMRDLGLPAVVENYPEPVIESGLFPADYADMYRKWHQKISEGTEFLEATIPLTKDRIPFHVRYTTSFDKAGKPLKAFGSATMVVDNKKEEELREIIDTLGYQYSNVYKINMDTWKTQFVRAEGFVPDNLIGLVKTDHEFDYTVLYDFIKDKVFPDDVDMMLKAVSTSTVTKEMAQSDTYSKTFRLVMGNSLHYVKVMYLRLKKSNNIICAFQNIDEIIASQQENENRLEKALVSAKKANAAKTVFLSNMSHDIRTPLNGIIGLMDINERHKDDMKLVWENHRKMQISAKHLLSLINNVLDLSKMEDENTEIVKVPIDIRDVFKEIELISDTAAQEKGINFYLRNDIEKISHPFVYGSALHIKQIFINLINNSIKYNKKGGSVSWNINCRLVDGSAVFDFKISDTGIGISDDFQKRMFDPFTQEKSGARSEYKGTGLGLSIVRVLVEKMGGTINVESMVGVGTTFNVSIPFDVASGIENKNSETADIVSIKNRRILVAEDNAINAEIMQFLFDDTGAYVDIAENGQEAVDMLCNNQPGYYDIVLMDVNMPVMDGLMATRVIRNQERPDLKVIPIVAVTASAFVEDILRCKEAGMDDHIAKPIDANKVIELVCRMLKKRSC